MYSESNDLENSEKSESGSQKIIISWPSKKWAGTKLSDEKKGSSRYKKILGTHYFESQLTQPSVEPSPGPDVLSEEARLHRERIPQHTKSDPNLININRKLSNRFHPSLRVRSRPITTQPDFEMKNEGAAVNNFSPILSSVVNQGFTTERDDDVSNISPVPKVESSLISGLFSSLMSRIASRTFESLDESVLNKFNLQVGTIASRIDMWRQRLEDERSVMSDARSVDIGSSSLASPVNQPHPFITDETRHLLWLVKDLATSVFGRFSLGFLGIEERLTELLEMGSHMVFPAAEMLMMTIWRLLREILDLHGTDIDKNGRMNSVVEAVTNALNAIRSLIQLGNAYKNAHEPSDSEYTAVDSRSQLERSLASLDIKNDDM